MNLKPIGALVAGLLLTSALTNVTHAATTTSLNDISKSYAKTEIEALVADGILQGDGTGKFNPTNSMTRQEVAVLLTNVLHLPLNADAAAKFTDVQNWAKPYVGALVTANLTTGYSATKFGGSDKVTREQLAIFFMRAFNQETLAQNLNMTTTFKDDASINTNAKPYVGLNQRIGFINGIKGTDGSYSFKPKDTADRQTVAHLAYQFYKNGTGYQNTLSSVQQVSDVLDKMTAAMKEVDSYQAVGNIHMMGMLINSTTDYNKAPLLVHEYGDMTLPTDSTTTPKTQALDTIWFNGNEYVKASDGKWYTDAMPQAPTPDESEGSVTTQQLAPYLTMTENAANNTYTLTASLTAQQVIALMGLNDPTMVTDPDFLASMPKSDVFTIVVDKATFQEQSFNEVTSEADGSTSNVDLTFTKYNNVTPVSMDDIVKNALPMDQNPDMK